MGALSQIFFTIGTVILLGLALWFSVTIIGFLILAGVALVSVVWLRNFLIEKGILNPTPGMPLQDPRATEKPPTVTVIETSFTRIDETPKETPKQ